MRNSLPTPSAVRKIGKKNLLKIYQVLRMHSGPQHWWPGETPFEVIVGAILTQNTSWKNVEKAIGNLRGADALSPEKMFRLSSKELGALILPSGFWRTKAETLRSFLNLLQRRYQGQLERMFAAGSSKLRIELLALKGIGEETADAILLYAGRKSAFVIDAYTRRFLTRHGYIQGNEKYGQLQILFSSLPKKLSLYKDFHAQFVELGKRYCRARALCETCPLSSDLPR